MRALALGCGTLHTKALLVPRAAQHVVPKLEKETTMVRDTCATGSIETSSYCRVPTA